MIYKICRPLCNVTLRPPNNENNFMISRRNLWEFVNMMFNKPDEDRIKIVGPDRGCAEWVLRNGGTITWTSGELIDNYNNLPPESTRNKLLVIDGTKSSISHYGFSHLVRCTSVKKIILHECYYIDNRALAGLSYAKDNLELLQVSKCPNVSDEGVKSLHILTNLQHLVLFGLDYVKNLNECHEYLKKSLPKCKIEVTE